MFSPFAHRVKWRTARSIPRDNRKLTSFRASRDVLSAVLVVLSAANPAGFGPGGAEKEKNVVHSPPHPILQGKVR